MGERIEASPVIEVLANTEVRSLAGRSHLEEVILRHNPSGTETTIACGGLFCFIGAEPATTWLSDTVALDSRGFILTDRDLPEEGTAVQAFGQHGAAELIYLVGLYCLVSVTLNGFNVPVPETEAV